MSDGGVAGAGRWAVIGGGMLGLTLGLRLAQQGKRVVVFEAADRLGGLASAWTLGVGSTAIVWDRHYHVTLASDRALRTLLRELGLDDDIRWVPTGTGYYADGILSPASGIVDFLRLPTLTLGDRARVGLTLLAASRRRDWERLERIPVATWLTRWSGRHAFDRFWLPLLRAKLGESYRATSAAFIWATARRLDAARSVGLKHEQFGYVAGGYARVLACLAAALAAAGADVRTGARVASVDRCGDDVLVRAADGREERFDHVVVTAPSDVAARLCPGLSPAERARLRGVQYQGIVCASLLLREPLSPYYLTYITDPAPFTAVVEMSALVDREELGGNALVYSPKYVAPDDPLFDVDDADIESDFRVALGAMYPRFADRDVLAFRVSKVRRVFAVPTLGYSRSVPPAATSVAGVHIVNSAQIVNGTLNVDETVQLAERAARAFSRWGVEPRLMP